MRHVDTRYLPWILLALCGVILGWQQVRLATLSAALGERGLDGSLGGLVCPCGTPAEKQGGGIAEIGSDEDAGNEGEAQMSVEDELDAIYKQLNKQTAELEAIQKQKEALEAQRERQQLESSSHQGGSGGAAAFPGGTMEYDGWIFYQGMDFDGFDLLKKPSMRDKPSELVSLARSTPGCMAVNTNGWLKAGVAPRSTWHHWTDEAHKGLYVHKDAKIEV
uniref:Uncharacterized protein n=1 Tax=Pyramimonas obovata TaxID=1411642 RepID=A0A7S0RXK2_9CHLO|mmetsp:Transcript_8654/g.17935  ORF Transcript_8654/g.17935 Transcript_8654/m.17935 type:complete len:220 (+) Transcript_8654:396-1055(+)